MSDAKPPADHPITAAVRAVRRAVVLVVGLTVVTLGVIMLVTPGPAFVVIPLGLAILAIEFVWARRALRWVKRRIEDAAARAGGNRQQREDACEASENAANPHESEPRMDTDKRE
mgnify:CR=1 FL=1